MESVTTLYVLFGGQAGVCSGGGVVWVVVEVGFTGTVELVRVEEVAFEDVVAELVLGETAVVLLM